MTRSADTLLKTYREKRDFARTQEPSGGDGSIGELRFVVQKHDARRLHYDFRIEWEGVLKSWAVTRGPSLDPADKRLAVRVEDHPLDYGDFEGTIPEGEYGGGTVMLWDRGTWEPEIDPDEGFAKGSLKLRLHGKKMRGRWALVRMKGKPKEKRENWLLIKEKDEEAHPGEDILQQDRSVKTGRDMAAIASGKPVKRVIPAASRKDGSRATPHKHGTADRPPAKGALPAFRPVQLAQLVSEPPEGGDWLHEVKYDGYRVLIAVGGGDVRFFTRNEQDWTQKFSPLREASLSLPCSSALIDGEVVVFDANGRTDFSSLQQALSAGSDLSCFCFDLLEIDGEDISGSSLVNRKDRLETLLQGHPDPRLLYSDHVRGHGGKVFAGICKAGQEGIVSKRVDSLYAGSRNGDWLKTKCTRRQEFVIGGYAVSNKKGRAFASLLVGVREGTKLHYRGRVGTGFTADVMADLASRFSKLAVSGSPFDDLPRPVARTARFVKPKLVAEVDFAEFTADDQIRHGAFKGLRNDKPAAKVTDETPVTPARAASTSKRAIPKATVVKHDKDEAIEVASVRVTHPGRLMFEKPAVSKGDLARYYEAVADRMLVHAGGRPLSLKRCPGGVSPECFFQKHAGEGFPEALGSVTIQESDGNQARYMTLSDAASIVAAVQMGGIEFHIGSGRNADPSRPDRLVFDLDPDEGLAFADVLSAARLLCEALQTLGLKSFAMVTGGKGIHVVAPIAPKRDVQEVAAFAKGLATRVAESDPDRFVAVMSKSRRKGRIFIDWLRNAPGQTAIAPYSVRARSKPAVAVPVSWRELNGLESASTFDPKAVLKRLDRAEPWAGYPKVRQFITNAMMEAVSDHD
ncbi:DNA ligase D [Aureimonas sp. ME7]|uniref:DNA ligase D n=1 Tax=Aureimonas sp. ME7 TaxID=2744252 RepID=UPI0015F9B039|nr:DNA ligase D [Aureimonas sp. ME7]